MSPAAAARQARRPAVSYTSQQLVNALSVTHRQLQWWDEHRVVRPQHGKHRRLYSEDQATLVAVIVRLRESGWSLQSARKFLRRGSAEIVRTSLRYLVLATPNQYVFLADAEAVGKFLADPRCGQALVVDLGSILDVLKENA